MARAELLSDKILNEQKACFCSVRPVKFNQNCLNSKEATGKHTFGNLHSPIIGADYHIQQNSDSNRK